jgi:tripartite ATP-independent transporter DctP family solute receptor
MSKVKNSFLLVLGAVFLLVCALPISGQAAEEQITLRLGHEFPDNHPYHKGGLKFGELLAQKTNNAIKVQIFPNGTIGKQAQLIESLVMGTLDLSLTNNVVLEKLVPLISVLSMPYVYRDWEHLYHVVDGEIGAEFNKMLEQKGVTVLSFFKIGDVIIHSTKLIKTPDDVRGLKMRVMPGPSMIEVGKILGAVTTPTAVSEVYTALQLGTIDAQLQSISNVLSLKHNEVGKYLISNQIAMFLEPLSMSMRSYNRLTPAQQKACREAAYEAAVWQRELMTKTEIEALDTLEKSGVTITRPDLNEWRTRLQPMYDRFPDWLPMIKRIQAMK